MHKKWLKVTCFSLLGTAVLLLAFLHSRAYRLVAPPRTFTWQTPSDYGITNWQEVTFLTSDSLQLSGWYIPPTGRDGATLIFVHGLGSNRSDLLDQAAMLIDEGFGALLFDLRAHGRSQGKQSSWGLKEVADVKAALTFLQQQQEVTFSSSSRRSMPTRSALWVTQWEARLLFGRRLSFLS